MTYTNLYVDFETYYDTDYSLKKIRTIQYVRDPRFEIQSIAAAIDDGPTKNYTVDEFKVLLATLDPSKTRIIAHNTYFDGLILTEHFKFIPARWACTLSMARALLPTGHENMNDLDNVAKLLGFGGKYKASALVAVKGLRLIEIPTDVKIDLDEYCVNDTEKCREIFNKLAQYMPADEHEFMHIVLRCGIEPVLELDEVMLEQAVVEISTARDAAIAASGYTAKQLGSGPQFAEILRSKGIEPPMKISKDTGKTTFAFGKTDLGFKELISNYPEHAALFKARIATKSTNELKRAEAMLDIARHPTTHTFPMPLKYSGAHTHRLSGADRLNVQNFNRGSKLRLSINAPDGYVICVYDLAGIELRVNHWFGDEWDTLALIAAGEDVYCKSATDHFGYPVVKGMEERHFGKMLELALGFGMGPFMFRYNAAVGFMGCPETHMSEAEAYQAVHSWRARKQGITGFWKFLETMLPLMTQKDCDYEYKCVRFVYQGVVLPNGLMLHYPNLRCTDDGWVYGVTKAKKIYGGLFCENIVQAVARVIISEMMLKAERTIPHFRTVSTTHDEDIALIRENDHYAANQLHIIMTETPEWAPGLPLDAEGGFAKNYSK